MSKTVQLLIATTNEKKLKELRDLLAGLPIQCVSLKAFPQITTVEETGETFEANAKLKAIGYAGQSGVLTLGEDSGLCCTALQGAPGVMSARFSGEKKDDDANNRKLLQWMETVPEEKRNAYYESAIAIAEPRKLLGTVSGRVHGLITRELRGNGGFGYDPLFFYPPFGKTFGQVPIEMKHRVSHRSVALAKARNVLAHYLSGV